MRQIGTITDGEQAEKFADFLRGQGTTCNLDSVDGGWAVWVHDEDRVAAAKEELQTFLAEPNHERYANARKLASAKIREEFDRRKEARKNQVSLRQRWDRPAGEASPLTMGMLAVCAVVAFYTRLGGDFTMPGETFEDVEPYLKQLWIGTSSVPGHQWDAVESGEIWRLWTPIFIHFGWLHILFNGLWLKEFGMMIESRLGSFRFLIIVLIIGAVSNALQLQFGQLELANLRWLTNPLFWNQLPHNYHFGGMSGVNYGLFGYLWVRGKLQPDSGLGVSPQTVMWMIVWFVVCWTGYAGPVANWAHAGGLATGVALGALAASRR